MRAFVYEALPVRVLFGWGMIAEVAAEAERLGMRRALVLSTPGRGEALAHDVASRLGERSVGVHAGAVMHTPVSATEAALKVVRERRVDGLVAVGGGSTTGLGKALALRTDLPQIVLPTTYAGSEMTPILGETEAGKKATRRDPRVLPETVIYDPALSAGLPLSVTATSGLNAIAHAVEALYAENRNPVIDLLAEEGIRRLGRALITLRATPEDRATRTAALYGAWLCGVCLGSVGMALHHKLCHVLGGMFDLPHAETHAIILPHVVAFNAPAASDAVAAVGRALGAADAARGLEQLARALGTVRALRDIGMPEDGIDRVIEVVLTQPPWNPRKLTEDGLRAMLGRAWRGAPPGAD
jgi:maleylacetate reductase